MPLTGIHKHKTFDAVVIWLGFGFWFWVSFLIKLFDCANSLNFPHKKRQYTRVFKDKCEAFQFCQNKSKVIFLG